MDQAILLIETFLIYILLFSIDPTSTHRRQATEYHHAPFVVIAIPR